MSKPDPIALDGAYSLLAPYGKYTSYRVEWYDKPSRQTDGLSTRTTDLETAKAFFKAHCLKHSTACLKDEPLLDSCNRYFLKYGHKLASASTFQLAMASTMAVLADPAKGNFGPLVSEMGVAVQNKLIDTWREAGTADATILRWLGCLWAAMKYAAENEHINATVVPKRISAKRWNPYLPNRTRVLTHLEMATLLDAACLVPSTTIPQFKLHPPGKKPTYYVWWSDPETSKTMRRSLDTTDAQVAAERLKVFTADYVGAHPVTYTEEYDGVEFRCLLSLIASGSRQKALVDLVMPTQIKFDYGVMDLNPVGRKQTKKFRPIIPMARTFAQWLTSWQPLTSQGHLLGAAGAPLESTRAVFKWLRRRTGIACSAQVIRHTVASWLAARVPAGWERDQFMGWRRSEGSAMASVYSHYDPKYLRNCSDVVQLLLEAIAGHMVGDLLRQGRVDQPLPPTDAGLDWITHGLSGGFSQWVNAVPSLPPESCIVLDRSEDPNPACGTSEVALAWRQRGAAEKKPTSESDENPVKTSVGRLGLEPRTNTLKGSAEDDKGILNQ